MVYASPPRTTRSQVTKIGRRIAEGIASLEDITAFEQWRGAHAYVINTFQANLRRRSRGTEIVVGTRLKRRETMILKDFGMPFILQDLLINVACSKMTNGTTSITRSLTVIAGFTMCTSTRCRRGQVVLSMGS